MLDRAQAIVVKGVMVTALPRSDWRERCPSSPNGEPYLFQPVVDGSNSLPDKDLRLAGLEPATLSSVG
jgi:hypothetical protein